MKCLNVLLCCVLFAVTLPWAQVASADSVPELLHYRFDGTDTSVPNHASNPPAGAEAATILGDLTQDGADLNYLGNGHSLVGNGMTSNVHYVDAHWETNLTGTSWTISFVTENVPSTTTTQYIFGDINAGQFRCFTGGVAGPGNWILRGAFADVSAIGGAATGRTRTTFVYDMPMNEIRAYVNGMLVSTVAQGLVAITGIGPFKVGAYATNNNLPQDSLLDDFRLYNRALTLAEIQAIDTHARIEVSGDGQSIASGDATPDPADDTEFGPVPVGDSVVHTYTIENTGNLDLDISSIELSGADAADFEVLNLSSDTLIPAESATFDVRFTPSAVATRAATVTVSSNAGIDPAFTFAIQGSGTGPVFTLTGIGQPINHDDATPSDTNGTDFGGVAVQGGTVENAYLLVNTGSSDLVLTDAIVGGATPEDFSVAIPPPPVVPGGNAVVTVEFDPSLTGLRSATITLVSNSAIHPNFTFAVGGEGLVTALAVNGNGVAIVDGDTTPDAADHTHFGAAVLGGATVARTFTIENTGAAPLVIDAVTLDGPAAADFAITQAPDTVVPTEGSTSLTVTFEPQTFGARRATLTIQSNALDDAFHAFDIEGDGQGADVQISKSNLQPHLQAGLDTVYTIQVLNAGPAEVSAVRIFDQLPANLLDGQWQCLSSPSGLCPNASGGPDIDETSGPLASGALLEYTLVATPDGTPSDFVTNTATVENLDGSDPDTQNNSASDTDPIVPAGIYRDGFEAAGKQLLQPRIGG